MNHVASKIDVTWQIAEYDEGAKWLLCEKIILAHILVYSVREYAGMNPWEVVDLIEGAPEVSAVRVYPGETNATQIVGESTESVVPHEGKVTYDMNRD